LRRADLFGLIAAGYAGELLLQLSRLPIATDMLTPRTAIWLANRHQLDPSGLHNILRFLALTTSIIKDQNGRYQLTEIRTSFATLRFSLEKFQEAYRLPLRQCLQTLGAPPAGSYPP
jgi:hypothetical protein